MGMTTAKTITIDRGWNKLLINMEQLATGYTKVGVQQGEKHKPSSKGSRPTETSDMVKVAAANEFGAPKRKIPERSFIRKTADVRRPAIAKQQTELVKAVIDGRLTPKKALTLLGMRHKADVQDWIIRIDSPENRPSTKLRKKSSSPLQDTGQLKQSIRYVVEGL